MAENPTLLHVLGLLVGFPLLAIIVITVLVKASGAAAAKRKEQSKYTDPTWIGSKEKHDEVLGADNAAGKAALQGGPPADQPADTAHPTSERGGASARW